MSELPWPLRNYLRDLAEKDRSPGFLLLESEGELKIWGGELAFYGLTELHQGADVGDQIPMLDGFFPLDEEGMELSCVETDAGVAADIHMIPDGKRAWVLFLDATEEKQRQQTLQQTANDLRLLRSKYAKLADRCVEEEILLSIQERGEYRHVSVLFADIRGMMAYGEKASPGEVFRLLDMYLTAMTQPVLDEGGMVNKIVGGSVMGIFGILPSKLPPPLQAGRAAFRVFDNTRTIEEAGRGNQEDMFDISIGVASGQVFLGAMGARNRKTLNILGPPVHLASHFEARARSGEVLICENTFQEIDDLQPCFSNVRLASEGGCASLRAFSCNMRV